MAARQRKTVVVCPTCHVDITHGRPMRRKEYDNRLHAWGYPWQAAGRVVKRHCKDWKAGCIERCKSGSAGGGWKRDNHSSDVDHTRWPPTRPCGYVPREKSRKTWVLGFPRTPKSEVVGHSSLSVRQGSANASGTAQERIRLNGGAPSAIPPPLRGAPSRSHAPFLSVSRTEEWQKKPRDFSRGGVSQYQ